MSPLDTPGARTLPGPGVPPAAPPGRRRTRTALLGRHPRTAPDHTRFEERPHHD